MGMPSARISDMHVCPMVTGVVPHVGGPIMPPGVGGYHGSDLFAAGCRGGGVWKPVWGLQILSFWEA